MGESDLDGKRVRYDGKEWLVTSRRICAVEVVTLTEVGHPTERPPRVVPFSADRVHELEVVSDD